MLQGGAQADDMLASSSVGTGRVPVSPVCIGAVARPAPNRRGVDGVDLAGAFLIRAAAQAFAVRFRVDLELETVNAAGSLDLLLPGLVARRTRPSPRHRPVLSSTPAHDP